MENFAFEILKDDFNTQEEMQQYESDMIIAYDSVNNGYNQTYQTSRAIFKMKIFKKISKNVVKNVLK